MMLLVVCKACAAVYRIDTGSVDPVEAQSLVGMRSDWWPNRYPCVLCGGMAEMADSIDPAALAAMAKYDLTPQEAFAAFNGLGLPDEQDCGPAAVKEVLQSSGVKDVVVEQLRGSNRSILRRIVMEDGRTLHLASGAMGALVYRISKPRSHVQEMLDGV